MSLNFDALGKRELEWKSKSFLLSYVPDEPEVQVTSKLVVVFEFLEFLEGPIRDHQLPKGINQM